MAIGVATPVATAAVFALSPVAAHAAAPNKAVAQIEVSANCDLTAPGACEAATGHPDGGIWFWTDLDAAGGGDVSGAECGHTVGGVGGPGGAGGGSLRGDVSWTTTSLEEAPMDAVFFGTIDPSDNYYLVTGPTIGQWLIPATDGHYSVTFGPGVQIQITVAP